jgi:Dockerin type I domain
MTPANNGPVLGFNGLDTNSTFHRQSWMVAMSSGAPVDINNLGNNDLRGIIDDFGNPGNWLIRADSLGFVVTSASSRMTHSRQGDFDIDLPLSGDIGIECRNDLSGITVVFTFSNDIASVGSATTSCGNLGSTTISGNQVLQKFDGSTCNQSNVTVTLNNVTDTLDRTIASAPVGIGILIGDVTGDGRVKSGDVKAVLAVRGQQTNDSNFRDDVNVDGRINNKDVKRVLSHRDEVFCRNPENLTA